MTATSTAVFDHTSVPLTELQCQSTEQAEGSRTVVFRSRGSTLVRFVGGRIQTVVVHRLRGTVKLAGTNTAHRSCTDGQESHVPDRCPPTTRSFNDGQVALSSRAAGTITVGQPRVALPRIGCPDEPAEVVAAPLGPRPGPLHVALGLLNNARAASITVTASATRRKTYGKGEKGTLLQRAAWKLRFVRVAR